ncbi:MAG: O-antigen ligase family protein [Bacteroidales bacterium]|nr:O-antigen ligase family protein [Lentimicrobiaceae bacterium]MDD5694708.1 O-antigen ligase family protein [Bacteroidales bacterium]
MIEKYKLKWVYLISALFVLLTIGLILMERYYFALLVPLLLIITLLYIFTLDKVLLLVVFLTPLAVNVRDIDIGVGISIPTEPLLFGVLVLFILRLLYRNDYDRKILRHPVSIIIMINLLWILFTSLTSEIPLVSFKFFIARLWFVIPFYFLGILLFRKIDNIKLFNWLYIIPLLAVIGYTIYNHSKLGFDEEAGHWVMTPFYNDHTAYGAILALFIPVFTGFIFDRSYTRTMRLASAGVLMVLILALILSFSRAAWISLAAVFIIYLIILLRIKFRYILLTIGVFIGIFIMFKWEILDALEKNKQDSSANFIEHVQSISNISSDASNLERINRWQSAIRMYRERPFWGWGPGTYQFLYAPFQRTKEKTIISTNFGDMGNAHSEYIGPLAESGLPGMLITVALVISFFITGLRVYKEAATPQVKLLAMITLLGLMTYFIHGILNNFLDTDKASVPVWSMIGILVALDLYHRKRHEEVKVEEEMPVAE